MIEVDGQYLGLDTITIMYDYLSMNNNGPFIVITIIIDTWSHFCGGVVVEKNEQVLIIIQKTILRDEQVKLYKNTYCLGRMRLTHRYIEAYSSIVYITFFFGISK